MLQCAAASTRCAVAAGDSHGVKSSNAPAFERELSSSLSEPPRRALLRGEAGRAGDALYKPLLPELYEPFLTNIGNGLLVLRGFEREGEAAMVQEWRCEVIK